MRIDKRTKQARMQADRIEAAKKKAEIAEERNMGKISQIEVVWKLPSETDTRTEVINDWFEFADWLKQRTLEQPITIVSWKYVEPSKD